MVLEQPRLCKEFSLLALTMERMSTDHRALQDSPRGSEHAAGASGQRGEIHLDGEGPYDNGLSGHGARVSGAGVAVGDPTCWTLLTRYLVA